MVRTRRSPLGLLAPRGLATLGLVALAAGLAHCGTDAVGPDACRDIESARCTAAASCGWTEDEVDRCEEFYRDQCLHGVENASHAPTDAEVDRCVAAVKAVEACAKRGAPTMVECPEAAIVYYDPVGAVIDPTKLTPCSVITEHVHLLEDCKFVAKYVTPDGGVPDAAAPDAAADDAAAAAPDAAAADAGDTADASPAADAGDGG